MTTKSRPHPESIGETHPLDASQSVSPELLIYRHIEDARLQLEEGRERLKGARRRVVQLEDALRSWELLAAQMRARSRRTA